MENLHLLYPEISLALFALLLMAADLWLPKKQGRILYHLGMISACVTTGLIGLAYSNPGHYQGIGTLWVVDPMALFFKVVILATTILILALAVDYKNPVDEHLGTFTSLILLAAVGMMLLVSATDLLLVFLALELISISSFILVGFERKNRKSSEGALKYFLIGAFSAALLVFGISLFYGATGTTHLLQLPLTLAPDAYVMLVLGCLFILIGLGFKVSMAPFHFWVPDAYEGAPTPVTVFLSIAPKVAGMAVLLRIFTGILPHGALGLTSLLAFLAMLTMTVGNFTALFQTNIKRLLAYSSIAHAGYMLIGFVTGDSLGREGLLLYSLVYVFMNFGAFAVATVIGNENSYELEAYNGLAKRNFGLSMLMLFFLLSLAGIPPLAGFIGKFYLFAAAINGKFYWLAIVAVLNSVVSVYYYMRIVYHMFFKEPRTLEPAPIGVFIAGGLTIAAVGVFLIGIYPEPILSAVKLSAEMTGGGGGLALNPPLP